MKCPKPIPLNVQDPDSGIYYEITVPCGKCHICLQRRRMDWVFRNLQEFNNCYTCYFVTLTYDDDHLPFKVCPAGYYDVPSYFDKDSLCVFYDKQYIDEEFKVPTYSLRDMQLFIKRLRKYSNCNEIRYFWVSEYGGETLRPHYHMILYNFPGSQEDLSVALEKTWKSGFFYIGEGNEQTICYTCKYILGSVELPSFMDKPIMRSSRNPAIGKSFLTPSTVDYYRKRLQPYAITKDGNRCNLPRYLRNKIFDSPDLKEFIREKCEHFAALEQEKEVALIYQNDQYVDLKFQSIQDYVLKLRAKTIKANSNDLTNL